MVEVGSKAPEFTLFSSDKKEVSLSDYKGQNVVLLFFPFAFSSVCTKELCDMRDNMAQFNNWDAQVLGLSIDSPFTLAKFKEENQLNFPLLSDFNKGVSRAYNSLYEEFPAFGMRGVSKRSVFLVGKDGTIKHMEVCASPGDMPNFASLKETLSGLN